MSEDSITEYHCCSECRKMIEVPSDNPYEYEVGCLDKRGKPNKSGGLCRCDYYEV